MDPVSWNMTLRRLFDMWFIYRPNHLPSSTPPNPFRPQVVLSKTKTHLLRTDLDQVLLLGTLRRTTPTPSL